MDDRPMVTLPDGRVIPDRRRHRRVLERIAAEPLASIAIGLTLAVLAWGTITSNTRNATEARNAATNAKAASQNADAARSLAATIKDAQNQLAVLSATSRQTNFASLGAIEDTVICVAQTLAFAPQPISAGDVAGCKKPLTPPPVSTTTTTTR